MSKYRCICHAALKDLIRPCLIFAKALFWRSGEWNNDWCVISAAASKENSSIFPERRNRWGSAPIHLVIHLSVSSPKQCKRFIYPPTSFPLTFTLLFALRVPQQLKRVHKPPVTSLACICCIISSAFIYTCCSQMYVMKTVIRSRSTSQAEVKNLHFLFLNIGTRFGISFRLAKRRAQSSQLSQNTSFSPNSSLINSVAVRAHRPQKWVCGFAVV